MGDKREDYVNLGALYGAPRPAAGGIPRPDPTRGSVFVSHEETLRRELAITNARIVAELGPLSAIGRPVQPKRRIDAKGRPTFDHVDHRTTEDEAMRLSHTAALGIAGALAACGADDISLGANGTSTAEESHSANAARSTSGAENSEHPEKLARRVDELKRALQAPIEVNAALNAAGTLDISAGDISLHFEAAQCNSLVDGVSFCGDGAKLIISKADGSRSQILEIPAIYLNSSSTLYRGPLDDSYKNCCQSFVLTDVNDDGKEDLLIWSGREGVYGGPSYDIFLFDTQKNKFVFSHEFSDLTIGYSGLFSIAGGKIKTATKEGCCLHIAETYSIESGLPILIERETVDSKDGEESAKVKIERFENGELKEVENGVVEQ